MSQDEHTSAVARDALASLEPEGVKLHPMFELAAVLSPSAHEVSDAELPMMELKQEDIGMILHSSGEHLSSLPYIRTDSSPSLHYTGSTSHPKPIYWSHKGLVRWSTTCCECTAL